MLKPGGTNLPFQNHNSAETWLVYTLCTYKATVAEQYFFFYSLQPV